MIEAILALLVANVAASAVVIWRGARARYEVLNEVRNLQSQVQFGLKSLEIELEGAKGGL
jgi:hypothetical protein